MLRLMEINVRFLILRKNVLAVENQESGRSTIEKPEGLQVNVCIALEKVSAPLGRPDGTRISD